MRNISCLTVHCLFFSLICSLFFSCENSKSADGRFDVLSINEDDFENNFQSVQTGLHNQPVLVSIKTQSKFNGILERNSTSLRSRQSYKNGLLDGKSSKISNDGSSVEAIFKEGKLHGEMQLFDKNGNLRSVISYHEGQLVDSKKN